jgi:hypothetical protein
MDNLLLGLSILSVLFQGKRQKNVAKMWYISDFFAIVTQLISQLVETILINIEKLLSLLILALTLLELELLPMASTERPLPHPPELLKQPLGQSTDQRCQYCPLDLGKRWG